MSTTPDTPVDYNKSQRKKSKWMLFVSLTRKNSSLKELYGVHEKCCKPFYIPKKKLSNDTLNPKYEELKRLYKIYRDTGKITGLSKIYKKKINSDEYKSSAEYQNEIELRKKNNCRLSNSSGDPAIKTKKTKSKKSKITGGASSTDSSSDDVTSSSSSGSSRSSSSSSSRSSSSSSSSNGQSTDTSSSETE